MTEAPKTYELATLRDIYEKVPADRLEACLTELGVHLAQIKRENEFSGKTLKMPVVWTDDGILTKTQGNPSC